MAITREEAKRRIKSDRDRGRISRRDVQPVNRELLRKIAARIRKKGEVGGSPWLIKVADSIQEVLQEEGE